MNICNLTLSLFHDNIVSLDNDLKLNLDYMVKLKKEEPLSSSFFMVLIEHPFLLLYPFPSLQPSSYFQTL